METPKITIAKTSADTRIKLTASDRRKHMRKSSATRAVELMAKENPEESLDERDERIRCATGLPLETIRQIRSTVSFRGPEW